MIFALFLGAILGFTALPLTLAFVVLAVSLGLKVIADIRFEKLPFFNAPSPFLIYCHNLAERGEPTADRLWSDFRRRSAGLRPLPSRVVIGGGC